MPEEWGRSVKASVCVSTAESDLGKEGWRFSRDCVRTSNVYL